MVRPAHSTRRRLIALAGGCALAAALAVPVAADDGGGSCVATFVLPQALHSGQSSPFGETVRVLTVMFYPLGQTVSFQAGSPRDACPFQAPG
jgi:hypothetical protein